MKCQKAPIIPNGVIAQYGPNHPGVRRTISCNTGYYLYGDDPSATCHWDGTWKYTSQCLPGNIVANLPSFFFYCFSFVCPFSL